MKFTSSLLIVYAVLLSACATPPAAAPEQARSVSITRTAYGVPHIQAQNMESLAYGVAYAHAQDNVCQTAMQLVTVRGERSLNFGVTRTALLGRRVLNNEQIDFFIAAHMDDAALAAAWGKASADALASARGYVAGYNRFLQDYAGKLPRDCQGAAWVKPMTLAQYYRLGEIGSVQAGLGALADAMLAAQRPAAAKTAHNSPVLDEPQLLAAARELGLADSPLGSNAWAFGRDLTANKRGLLLGNPHFPWSGVNRFYQMHLTVPGKMDVMGASTGHSAVVHIGFNKDVAWTHTVSTGKRFTVHELTLQPGDASSYLVDGVAEPMRQKTVSIQVRGADGSVSTKTQVVWSTRFGPLIHLPRLGLGWSAARAYALQDANTLNARSVDSWLGINAAKSVEEIRAAIGNLGVPWVNTIAVDRAGQALYADVSVVPSISAAKLAACKPSAGAAALLASAAGIAVLDGSRSACNWEADASSAVRGLTAAAQMPVAIRSDWVQNANDSFFYTHPQQRFANVPPLVGDAVMRRPRTRSSLMEIAELTARGPVTAQGVQAQLFSNRNLMARVVLPDLLAACASGSAPAVQEVRDGCTALGGWDRNNNLESRGAHLFREFWRSASVLPGVFRVRFDPAQPTATPAGLNFADAQLAPKIWDALSGAVKRVRTAGHALDAPLGQVQRPMITEEPIALHGGDEIEGVLNNLGNTFAQGIGAKGLQIDYGTSYVQTVSFDERGPVAQAILTYGQSTDPASAHAVDQLRLFSQKRWVPLAFHPEDVARERVGEVLRLVR